MGIQKDIFMDYLKNFGKLFGAVDVDFMILPNDMNDIIKNTYIIRTEVNQEIAHNKLVKILSREILYDILNFQNKIFKDEYIRAIETNDFFMLVKYDNMTHLIKSIVDKYYWRLHIYSGNFSKEASFVISSDFYKLSTLLDDNKLILHFPSTSKDFYDSIKELKEELYSYSMLLLYETIINKNEPNLLDKLQLYLNEQKAILIEKEEYEKVSKLERALKNFD